MNVDLDLKQDNTFDVSMPFPESGKWTIASGQLQLFTTDGQMVMTGTFTTDAKTLNMMADQTPVTLTRAQSG